MAKKRSRSAVARKGARPAHCWGAYLVVVTLLLLGVTVAASQLLWASVSPEPAVSDALSPLHLPINAEAVSPAPGGDDGAQALRVYGGGMRPLVEETDGAQTLNIYGPGEQIIAQVVQDDQVGEEVRYLLTDHLGSTQAALDSDGNAVAHFEYGPHGETTAAGSAVAEVQYRYTGHPYDEGQEVYETPNRVYDPALARFLSVDPQREAASPYTYVTNNPVLYKDPDGKGRVGTVITTQVLAQATKLVAETSQYDSTSRFLYSFKDPVVFNYFARLASLHKSDRRAFNRFADRITRARSDKSLRSAFRKLPDEKRRWPRVNAKQRVRIKSEIEEFRRLFDLKRRYRKQESRVIKEEYHGVKEAYFRSPRSLEALKYPTESAPRAGNGFGNCREVSRCIAGQIAENDSEVNVELFFPDPYIDHYFVVVGRDPKTNESKPMSWNKEAHIVDGWLGFVKPAKQYYANGINTEYFNKDFRPVLEFTFE